MGSLIALLVAIAFLAAAWWVVKKLAKLVLAGVLVLLALVTVIGGYVAYQQDMISVPSFLETSTDSETPAEPATVEPTAAPGTSETDVAH